MDLQNIQEQLNTEFAKPDCRIIFWFDDKGDYAEEVSELQLDGTKLHILDGSNWLYSKWLLNEQDTESKYLVYAPFSKPSDEENPLADMYYYSVPYYTDRISQMSQELGIDNKYKEHLGKYSNFWKNKNRIEKFKELGIDHYTTESIDIGLIAVLTDVKTPSFEEIVKQLMIGKSAEYLKALEYNGLLESFWNLCGKYFSYDSEKPNLEDMTACLITTYAAASLRNTIPGELASYVLKKRNDVVVFVRNIMDNVLYQKRYDELSEIVDKTLRLSKKIEENLKKNSEKVASQMNDVLACDAFQSFDHIILAWAIDKLNDEILDAEIDGLNIGRIAELRTSSSYHFGQKFQNEYEAIKYAYLLMKSITTLEVSSNIEELIKAYQKDIYLIDSYYRWFYYAYDQITDNEIFAKVRERVVEVKTAKGKQETDFVDVIITTVSRKVTNLTTFFDFIQTEKVTDVMKGRNLVAFFTTEDGEKISYDVPLMANSQSDEPEKRTFHEKFTLKSRKYVHGDKYFMNIVDANDEKNVLHSYEFMIDIAFVDDFGF